MDRRIQPVRDLPVTTCRTDTARVSRAPRRIVITALAAIVLVVGIALAASSTSAACGACHSMKPYTQTLQAGAHSGIACYECHLQAGAWDWPAFKFTEVFRMYPSELAGNKPNGSAQHTSVQACSRCHSEDIEQTIEQSGLRIAHTTCALGSTCDGCHSGVAHGDAVRWVTEPQMEDCVGCHRQEHVSTKCDLCHAGKSSAERLTKGSWTVTHGPQWETAHGMGDLRTCDVCHEARKCESCHQIPLPHPLDFGSTHPDAATSEPATCVKCHDRIDFCDQCHGVAMPHTPAFTEAHPTLVSSVDDARCVRCHRREDCIRCHVAHIHPGSTDGNLRSTLPAAGD